MPWLRTIPEAEATGRLAEAYDWQSASLGRPTEFTRLGSLDAEIVHARLANFDYRIVESARDLGASPFGAFLTVTLPIIRPIVIGAALIAMALSIDDFVITFFTIGSGNTLPTLVWGMIRTGLTPMVNAIGTLILLLTLGSSLVALRLTRYRG